MVAAEERGNEALKPQDLLVIDRIYAISYVCDGPTSKVRKPMRQLSIAVLSALVMIGLSVSAAFATSGSSGALVVAFDEAGVGQQQVDYSLHITTATATYACINGGDNHPKAANKETFSSSVTTKASFQPENGRVQGSITVPAISAGSFSCPSGQSLVLASVSYSGITLTDLTNNVSTSVPNASRTFIKI